MADTSKQVVNPSTKPMRVDYGATSEIQATKK
ncbi:hypothetical protein CCACVL1_18189 [Corchorus capsularis]|uniref:Uncharacterized protein n=1 Tax=Corchorus capsularis TaxID=210143 RepID=A0A1R3HM56_COCAP|nr:hypothetical protein CCACVL1_18189 [Corchorus capsularis]